MSTTWYTVEKHYGMHSNCYPAWYQWRYFYTKTSQNSLPFWNVRGNIATSWPSSTPNTPVWLMPYWCKPCHGQPPGHLGGSNVDAGDHKVPIGWNQENWLFATSCPGHSHLSMLSQVLWSPTQNLNTSTQHFPSPRQATSYPRNCTCTPACNALLDAMDVPCKKENLQTLHQTVWLDM